MSGPEIGQAKLFEVASTRLTLQDRFLVPPFSVLDARAGYWQDRKRDWLNVGIEPELGREDNLLHHSEADMRQRHEGSAYPRGARARELALLDEEGALLGASGRDPTPGSTPAARGRGGMTGQLLKSGAGRGDRLLSGAAPREGYGGDYDLAKGQNAWGGSGTSLFDPVLCELVYRWFSPAGGLVFDPFAGGSVRGVVAAMLGLSYHGTDLSERQVEANREQAERISQARQWTGSATWSVCDARLALGPLALESADLVFSCPPYYDLEVYSDDPSDLSAAPTYEAFRESYQRCVDVAVAVLKPDRFACFVVGEVRDKKTGAYVGLVPDTIAAFEAAGAAFYNEGILVTSVGSLPIRTSRLFGPGRKFGKSHQNVLVFVKGSWREAVAACPMPDEVAVEYGGATWRTNGVVLTEHERRELEDFTF